MDIDYQKLKKSHLEKLRKNGSGDVALAASQELERRKTHMPDQGHAVSVARHNAILGAVVALIVAILSLAGPKIYRDLRPVHPAPSSTAAQKPAPTDSTKSALSPEVLAGGKEEEQQPKHEDHPLRVDEPKSDDAGDSKGREPSVINVVDSPATSSSDSATANEEPPIILEAIAIDTGDLSASDAKDIADKSRKSSDEIIKCLGSRNYTTCMYLYGAQVFEIKDDLHDHNTNFAALNESIDRLKTDPSSAVFRQSAQILRAVADHIDKSLADLRVSRPKEQVIDAVPLFIGPEKLSSAEALSISSTAQEYASKILGCLAANKPIGFGFCMDRDYGVAGVASVRNHLRKDGVEFEALNDALHQLDTKPSAPGLRRAALVLRSVADKLVDLARQSSDQSGGDRKAAVSLELPKELHIRKGRLHSIARDSELIASEIEACTADFPAGICANRTVFDSSGHGSVVQEVNNVRGRLSEAGVFIEQLEEGQRMLNRGPSVDDLRYIARVLDELSKQLNARAR